MDPLQQNQKAWNTGTYEAWLHRFGNPTEAAAKLKASPEKRIGNVLDQMGELRGKRIMNLMGSGGNKAVALALLGAEVTVADFSAENAKYAEELALAAGVPLTYIVSDVLKLPEEVMTGTYDIVFMEFGILHYFVDLAPLFHIVNRLLTQGGRLVLQDFHPISTKLISSRGTTANIRKHRVDGDYFDTSVTETEISFYKFLPDHEKMPDVQKVQLRHWNLGEIVTAVAEQGLCLKLLEELPNLSSDVFDKGIPKTFTIVAEKL